MDNKAKLLLSIVLLGLIILLYQNRALNNSLESMNDNNGIQAEVIDNKQDELNELIQKHEEVIEVNKNLVEEIEVLTNKLEASEVPNSVTKFKLEKKGIDDYRIIEKDLMDHSELISINGVLGGTMYFTNVFLLNEKWVYATFEDGHIMGSALYEYKVISPKIIEWKEIEAISD